MMLRIRRKGKARYYGMQRRIYADHAATTPLSQPAFQAMLPYFTEIFANPSSLHSEGMHAADALSVARSAVAAGLSCSPAEIVFTSGGTESDVLAWHSAAMFGAAQGKRHFITSQIEHHAVLNTAQALAEQGFSVTFLSPNRNGLISPEQLRQSIREDTVFVSLMTANNEIGTIQPVSAYAAVCRAAGVLFHTDAVQAVGHIPLSFSELGCDYLSCSAHKFGGPKGVGVLLIRRGVPFTPLLFGGAQERGRRPGTENLPCIVGMAAALQDALQNRAAQAARLTPLRNRLMEGLLQIPYTVCDGDPVHRLPGNVHVCFAGVDAEALLLRLDAKGIAASAGAACSAGALEPSHVLLALGRPASLARGSLRLSLGSLTQPDDIPQILQAVTDAVCHLRRLSPGWEQSIPENLF